MRLRNKQDASAGEAFQNALNADGKLVEAQVELGMMAAGKSQWPEAVSRLDAALQLDPVDFPRAWFADAVANFNLKNFDGAEKSAREVLKLDPKHTNPYANQLLAMILAAKGDFDYVRPPG